MYSILIIDDEPIVKIALRSILPWEEHGFSICGTASNGLEAMPLIEKHQPDVIITHNDEDYMQDHVETSRIAFNGSFVSSLAHKSVNFAAYDEFVPIYFMDTLGGVNFIPTHYVDITNQIETKLEALKKHESQIKWMFEHDHIDFIDMIRTCSRYRGYQSGVTYAEGFRPCIVYPRMTTKHLLP